MVGHDELRSKHMALSKTALNWQAYSLLRRNWAYDLPDRPAFLIDAIAHRIAFRDRFYREAGEYKAIAASQYEIITIERDLAAQRVSG